MIFVENSMTTIKTIKKEYKWESKLLKKIFYSKYEYIYTFTTFLE